MPSPPRVPNPRSVGWGARLPRHRDAACLVAVGTNHALMPQPNAPMSQKMHPGSNHPLICLNHASMSRPLNHAPTWHSCLNHETKLVQNLINPRPLSFRAPHRNTSYSVTWVPGEIPRDQQLVCNSRRLHPSCESACSTFDSMSFGPIVTLAALLSPGTRLRSAPPARALPAARPRCVAQTLRLASLARWRLRI